MLYALTSILENGSWTVSKPIIKEVPVSIPFQLINFRRAILILKRSENLVEDTIGRRREGRKSVDIFDVTIRSSNMSDLDDIIDDFREIIIDSVNNHTDTTYSDIRYERGEIKAIIGSVYEAEITVTCYKIGKVF